MKRSSSINPFWMVALSLLVAMVYEESSKKEGSGMAPGYWIPEPGVHFQIQFSGEVDRSVDADVFDLDLFETEQETIGQFNQQGKRVICYVNVGAWEHWRPDSKLFPPTVIGKDYAGWEGEKWLDIRQVDTLRPMMEARLDLAKDKGCDAVDPDNMDGYNNETGFPLTYEDQLHYNMWLARQVHQRGMSIGLKNDQDQVQDLLPYFDWALTEDCHVQEWCDQMKPFISQGSAVFQVEYTDTGITTEEFCPHTLHNGFTGILKNRSLDAWITTCRRAERTQSRSTVFVSKERS